MTIPILLVIIGLILALVDEFRAQGQSLTAWAVIAVCLSLLWGNVS